MLLFLSATGITWSLYAGATVADIRAAFGWQRPQLDTALTTHQDTGPIDLDGVVSATNTVGVRAPLEFSLPAEPGQAAGVTEIDKAYRLTTNSAPVDPATLSVTSVVDPGASECIWVSCSGGSTNCFCWP